MDEKILEILLIQYPKAPEAGAKEITSHVFEFLDWILNNVNSEKVNTGKCYEWRWVIWAKGMKKAGVFDSIGMYEYWYNNVKKVEMDTDKLRKYMEIIHPVVTGDLSTIFYELEKIAESTALKLNVDDPKEQKKAEIYIKIGMYEAINKIV